MANVNEMFDYYLLLQLEMDATLEEIQGAIKTERNKWRNRQNSSDPKVRSMAEEQMYNLGEADKVFKSESSRKEYDSELIVYRRNKKDEDSSSTSHSTVQEDVLERVRHYITIGNSKLAHFAAIDATTKDSKNFDAWVLRAFSAIDIKKYDDAEYAAMEALHLDTTSIPAHELLADVYINQGKVSSAINCLNKASNIDSANEVKYQVRIGYLYLFSGEISEAYLHLKNLHEKYPEDKTVTSEYAQFVLLKALNDHKYLSDGKAHLTSRDELDSRIAALEEVNSLGVQHEPNVRELYEKVENEIAIASKLTFREVGCFPIVLAIAGFFLFKSLGAGGLVVYFVILALVIRFIIMKPQYVLNKMNLKK